MIYIIGILEVLLLIALIVMVLSNKDNGGKKNGKNKH